MSYHKNPLYNTPQITKSLKDHGLKVDIPNQLSDAFRVGYVAGAKTGKEINISISFPDVPGSHVYEELQNQPLPKIGETILIPIYNYKNGYRDSSTMFNGKVSKITHVPHADFPQVWIKLRNFNLFERIVDRFVKW